MAEAQEAAVAAPEQAEEVEEEEDERKKVEFRGTSRHVSGSAKGLWVGGLLGEKRSQRGEKVCERQHRIQDRLASRTFQLGTDRRLGRRSGRNAIELTPIYTLWASLGRKCEPEE